MVTVARKVCPATALAGLIGPQVEPLTNGAGATVNGIEAQLSVSFDSGTALNVSVHTLSMWAPAVATQPILEVMFCGPPNGAKAATPGVPRLAPSTLKRAFEAPADPEALFQNCAPDCPGGTVCPSIRPPIIQRLFMVRLGSGELTTTFPLQSAHLFCPPVVKAQTDATNVPGELYIGLQGFIFWVGLPAVSLHEYDMPPMTPVGKAVHDVDWPTLIGELPVREHVRPRGGMTLKVRGHQTTPLALATSNVQVWELAGMVKGYVPGGRSSIFPKDPGRQSISNAPFASPVWPIVALSGVPAVAVNELGDILQVGASHSLAGCGLEGQDAGTISPPCSPLGESAVYPTSTEEMERGAMGA